MSLPLGGIPGVPDGAAILILGNIYVLNDAPQSWWKKFDAVMNSIDFFRSMFVLCVRTLRGTAGTWRESCGGSGSLFSKALSNLGHRFPFRKWQVGEGMFCGSKCVYRTKTPKRS